MNKKLTILKPVKNRGFFLTKILQYYALAGDRFTIMLGDSSDPEYFKQNQTIVKEYGRGLDIIHCQHPTDISHLTSARRMLADVQTPYSVFAGDDDYLVPAELERCVQFLEGHPDYSCACGEQAFVRVSRPADGTLDVEEAHLGYFKNHEDPLPSQRVVDYVYSGPAINSFSVRRTEQMRFIWTKMGEFGLEKIRAYVNIHEYCENVMTLIYGKQKKFPHLYHVMLRHRERMGFTNPIGLGVLHRWSHWNWSEDIPKVVQWWVEELIRKEGCDPPRAYEIAEAIFISCLVPHVLHHRDWLLQKNGRVPQLTGLSKERIIQMIAAIPWVRTIWLRLRGYSKISLKKLLDKKSRYYLHFMPIYNVLIKV